MTLYGFFSTNARSELWNHCREKALAKRRNKTKKIPRNLQRSAKVLMMCIYIQSTNKNHSRKG
jgi:hypothetical protein